MHRSSFRRTSFLLLRVLGGFCRGSFSLLCICLHLGLLGRQMRGPRYRSPLQFGRFVVSRHHSIMFFANRRLRLRLHDSNGGFRLGSLLRLSAWPWLGLLCRFDRLRRRGRAALRCGNNVRLCRFGLAFCGPLLRGLAHVTRWVLRGRGGDRSGPVCRWCYTTRRSGYLR